MTYCPWQLIVSLLIWTIEQAHFYGQFFIILFSAEPYICKDWKETDFCGDTCNIYSTKLVNRVCFPIQVPLPEDVLPPVLIKPGKRKCDKYFRCTGYSNISKINPITRINKTFCFQFENSAIIVAGEPGRWSDWSECRGNCSLNGNFGVKERSRKIKNYNADDKWEPQTVDCQLSCPIGEL